MAVLSTVAPKSGRAHASGRLIGGWDARLGNGAAGDWLALASAFRRPAGRSAACCLLDSARPPPRPKLPFFHRFHHALCSASVPPYTLAAVPSSVSRVPHSSHHRPSRRLSAPTTTASTFPARATALQRNGPVSTHSTVTKSFLLILRLASRYTRCHLRFTLSDQVAPPSRRYCQGHHRLFSRSSQQAHRHRAPSCGITFGVKSALLQPGADHVP